MGHTKKTFKKKNDATTMISMYYVKNVTQVSRSFIVDAHLLGNKTQARLCTEDELAGNKQAYLNTIKWISQFKNRQKVLFILVFFVYIKRVPKTHMCSDRSK